MAARFDSRAITVMVAKGTAPAARAHILATAAREGVAELVRSGQASPRYTTFVDGVQGASEDAVRADGAIAYRFAYMGEVIVFALAFMKARSPVRSGRYRDSFMAAIDGRPVAASQVNPGSVPEGASLFLYNTQPYSRRIDVQLVGNRRLKFSVPPGLFDDTVRAIGSRFGNLVTARRLYTLKFPGQVATIKGKAVEYPAIEIIRR